MEDGALKDLLEGRKYPTDLLLVMLFSILSTVCALILPDGNVLRIIFGIPLLIFLPGYSLVSVLWPGINQSKIQLDEPHKTGKGLDNVERVMFSIGLSIVIIPIIGLILNYVSSITLLPILLSLQAITLVSSLLGWYIRNSLPEDARYFVSFAFLWNFKSNEVKKAEKNLTAMLISCIFIVASTLMYMIVSPPNDGQYSEFYLLNQNRTLEGLPNNLTVNETGTVVITIHNLENELTDYRIIAGVENITNPTTYVSAGSQIELVMGQYTATNISLDDSAKFEQEYTFHFSTPGRYRIVWNLLIDGQETDYKLHLWVNVA
jgi:uncharacterized membrane protein